MEIQMRCVYSQNSESDMGGDADTVKMYIETTVFF